MVNEFANKYPRTAYVDLAKEQNLPMPELKDYITKYQDPAQADNVTKIQKELDETKAVLHKTIESVLERGEKIDDLVAKSDGLSASSKMFYTQVSYSSARHVHGANNMDRLRSRTLAAMSCNTAPD